MTDKEKPPDKNESFKSDLRQIGILDVNRLCFIFRNASPFCCNYCAIHLETSVLGKQNKRKQETTHKSLKRSATKERTTSALLATTTVYSIYRPLAVAQC